MEEEEEEVVEEVPTTSKMTSKDEYIHRSKVTLPPPCL
jgi:hypothetical protein